MKIINSLNNQKIKDLVKLHKSSERKKRGLFIIDGAREIELAQKEGVEVLELFYCPKLIKRPGDNFFGIEREKITEISEDVFAKICYKEKTDGYFAVAKEKFIKFEQIGLSRKPLLIILEAVEKPGNLGAILRTAYAAGVDAIIMNDNQTDIYNPNVIRASEGFVFCTPIIIASVEETAKWLRKNNILSFAAATTAKGKYTKENMNLPIAIILGSEAQGLSDKWLIMANKLVKIPMNKGIDSLNVSVSAAILLYEVLRQRESQVKVE